jgi:UDP:flavonoid glycosyltransferase YjiC (YdhE family)
MNRSTEPLKILFSSRPAYGHLYPLMPLAEAARDAGHQVTFATGPEFVTKVQALGFPTRIAGISIGQAEQVLLDGRDVPRGDDGQPNYDVAASMFIDVAAWHTATDLFVLLDELRPDLVVYEAFDFGAPVAAHARGVPAVCHSISPQLPPEVIERISAGRLERLWAGYGITTPPLDVFAGDAYLDIFPPRLQEPSFLAWPARVPDLAVHHGGSGTTLGALVHGVPQVLLPKGADQFLNADKMATAGLAEALTPAAVTPDAVATLARAALRSSDRLALDEVRDEIAAMPHPSEVVTQLVDRFCLAG